MPERNRQEKTKRPSEKPTPRIVSGHDRKSDNLPPIRVRPELREKVENECADRDVTLTEWMREAIREKVGGSPPE